MDQQLLQAFVGQGDESAFAELVRRHGPMVLDAARCVLHNLHDAEDVFQATFLMLTRKAGSIRKQSSVASWLYGVAYRLAMKARASAAKRQTREQQRLAQLQTSAMDEMTWRELRLVLHEELQRLPQKYQAPLILCYFMGKTQDEAAQQLGWNKWTLKDRLERARDLLRKRLTRRGLIPSAALFATLVSHDTASAVPTALLDSTLNAGMLLATGQATTGAISAQAARLIAQGLRGLAFSKAKLAMTVFLALGMIAAGAGFAAYQMTKNEHPQEKKEAQQNPLAQNSRPAPPPKETQPRIDRYGDPLPPGAIARLGTLRFRHGGTIDSTSAFSATPAAMIIGSAISEGDSGSEFGRG